MAVRRRRDIWDVIVVGGGIAGLNAAWQASRHGLSVALFEREAAYGGQVATVNQLDDWPATGLTSGVELANSMAERLRSEGVEITHESILSLVAREDAAVVKTGRTFYRARRVIAAAGGNLRTLEVPGEEAFRGKGVSQCAHCDGGFFNGQDVVVVGGGDAALQEALVLAESCRTVTILVRSALKARRALSDKADSKTNVHFAWDTEVVEILGNGSVEGVKVRARKSGEVSELQCSGVFPFVGIRPNTEFLPRTVELNEAGRVITDAQCRTSISRVFAIGALRAENGGDLTSAAGEAELVAKAVAAELRL